MLVTCGWAGWQPATWVFSAVLQLNARMESWWRPYLWCSRPSNIQTGPGCAGGTWWIEDLEPSLSCHPSAKFAQRDLIAPPDSISVTTQLTAIVGTRQCFTRLNTQRALSRAGRSYLATLTWPWLLVPSTFLDMLRIWWCSWPRWNRLIFLLDLRGFGLSLLI